MTNDLYEIITLIFSTLLIIIFLSVPKLADLNNLMSKFYKDEEIEEKNQKNKLSNKLWKKCFKIQPTSIFIYSV